MQKPVVEVHDLGKKYRIKNNNPGSGKKEDFWALRHISFSLMPGERMALLGRNGSGKSTLFKLISEITDPTEGSIVLRGSVASILEVGVGFHHELTGSENIYAYGAFIGMRKTEITDKFDEIVSFSGIEKFLNMPLKKYSSGMRARLAFAVASHFDSEVLIVDEVLAVGDAYFREKALTRLQKMADEGCALIIVSHDTQLLNQLCHRAIHLENGKLTGKGSFDEVFQHHGLPEVADSNSTETPEI